MSDSLANTNINATEVKESKQKGGKLFIFAGGTGLHVANALARICTLLHTDILKPFVSSSKDPKQGALGELLVLDADVHSSKDDSLWQKFLKLYGNDYKENAHIHPVDIPKEKEGSATLSFKNYYDGESGILSYLFEENTLNINIKDGFFGRPNASSLVFYKRLEDLGKSEGSGKKVEDFFGQNIGEFSSYYITGSYVGGIGAGCIPAFVSWLQEKYKSKKIHILTHSNWFTISKVKKNINNDDLVKNAIGGFRYLSESIKGKKNILSIIFDLETQLQRENEGGEGQSEIPNLIYLLNAIILWNLKLGDLDDSLYTQGSIYRISTKSPDLENFSLLQENIKINNANELLFKEEKNKEEKSKEQKSIGFKSLIEKNCCFYSILKCLKISPAVEIIKPLAKIKESKKDVIEKNIKDLSEALNYIKNAISIMKDYGFELPTVLKDIKLDSNEFDHFSKLLSEGFKIGNVFDLLIKIAENKGDFIMNLWRNVLDLKYVKKNEKKGGKK